MQIYVIYNVCIYMYSTKRAYQSVKVIREQRTVFYQTVRRGSLQSMLDEVVISPMLHKVTGAGHSCKGGGGGKVLGMWGAGGGP